MKSLKVYLGIVFLILVVALGFVVYIWYSVQTLDATLKNPPHDEIILNDDEPKASEEQNGDDRAE